MAKNMKSINFSKLALICTATTILSSMTLEVQAAAGRRIEARRAAAGADAVINELAAGVRNLRPAGEGEVARAARNLRNIVQNPVVVGFVPHVALNPEIQNNNLGAIGFFTPLLREAPADKKREIDTALKRVQENGSLLTVARKVQVLETIKANGWHYNKDDIVNIPVNSNNQQPIVIVDANANPNPDPVTGYKSIFTADNVYKINYFHVTENRMREINITDKLVEAGKSFELEGSRAFRGANLTLEELHVKEKELILNDRTLKETIRSALMEGAVGPAVKRIPFVANFRNPSINLVYYDHVLDRVEEKNEYKRYLTVAEVNSIKEGRGLVNAYKEKAELITNRMDELTAKLNANEMTREEYDRKMETFGNPPNFNRNRE